MDRLTTRGEDGKGYFRALDPDCNCNRECPRLWDHMIMLASRLCDYEDTGFTPVDFSKVIKQLIDYKDLGASPERLKGLLKAENRYRTLYIELLQKHDDDLCSKCQNKPTFSCTKECPNYIEGKDGTIDGKPVDFPWSCMDFDWGECDRMAGTPCHGCIQANFRNFSLKEPDANA